MKHFKFEYYHELTPEGSNLDAGNFFISRIISSKDTYCSKDRQIPNPTKCSPYIIIKRRLSVLNKWRTMLSPGEYTFLWEWECGFAYVLYCEYGSCELFWNTNTRKWGHWQTNKIWIRLSIIRFAWKRNDWIRRPIYSHRFTTIWKPSHSNSTRFTGRVIWGWSLIEYTFANPVLFKDIVDCGINTEKVHLNRMIWYYLIPKMKIGSHKKNKWLAIVLTTSFIGLMWSKKTFLMSKPKCLGAQIWQMKCSDGPSPHHNC